jgi:hypothetical protein
MAEPFTHQRCPYRRTFGRSSLSGAGLGRLLIQGSYVNMAARSDLLRTEIAPSPIRFALSVRKGNSSSTDIFVTERHHSARLLYARVK